MPSYFCEIGNGTELRYKVLPYTIKILDSEEVAQKPEGESLEIQDHWTVQEVIVTIFYQS